MFRKKYTLERSGTTLRTVGLARAGFRDVCVDLPSARLEEAAHEMLRIFAEYQLRQKVVISDRQTVEHGSWIVEMRAVDDLLEVWEFTANGASPIRGAALTLQLWSDQNLLCNRLHAKFQPPRYGDFLSVSAGVFEGEFPLEGIRYPMERQMSGWILTTDRYTDVSSLRLEHTYHLVASRPEVMKYLALPSGFNFRVTVDSESIDFDKRVAHGE